MTMTIHTTYKTNAKGAGQIVAKGGKRQATVNYDHGKSVKGNHEAAMRNLVRKMEDDGATVRLYPRSETIEVDNGKARFVIGG